MRKTRGQAAYPLLGNEVVPEGKTGLCLNGENGVKLPSKQLVARSNRARDILNLLRVQSASPPNYHNFTTTLNPDYSASLLVRQKRDWGSASIIVVTP